VDDLRIAIRQYLRHPVFAITAVGTLAVATGATAAVFTIVHAAIVRALPYASPERLVWIASVRPDNPSAPFSLPEFMDYRSQARTLSGVAAYANWSAIMSGDGVPERLQGARVSGNIFAVLGVAPAAGRLFDERDDRPEAPPVVVISHRLWQRRFGGAADAVGRVVPINGEPVVIAGVLPVHFPLPLRDIDVMTPLSPERDPLRHVRNSVNFLRLFGRLQGDVDATQAEAELTAICRSLRQQFPVEYARKEAVRVVALHEVLVGHYRKSMFLLMAAVIVVLATALANLASLALVRTNARRVELSMRQALGASRRRLARQLVVEAAVLALAGSGLGWILAGQVVAAAPSWAPSWVPRLGEAGLDRSVATFTLAIAAVATAILSAAPFVVFASGRPGPPRAAVGDTWSRAVRNAMVVGEIGAALVLLLVTTVLIQNVLRLRGQHPGFNPDHVFQARLSLPPTYRSTDDLARFYERLSERLAAVPGVQSIGVISVAPLSGLLLTVPFSVEGQPTERRDRASANLRAISPGYLPTVGTRLVSGRSFAESDRDGTMPVALVSAALADRFLPGAAVGRRLLIDDNNEGPRPIEVIGVVENVRQEALDRPPALDVYIPLRQVHPNGVSVLRNNQFWQVRLDAGVSVASIFLAHLAAVEPDAAASGVGTMRQFLDASLGPRRFTLALVGTFALTAVLLAVTGLYGLVSYTVSCRTTEIGVRIAIGATGGDVERMILRQAAWLALKGAGLGVCLSIATWPAVSGTIEEAPIALPLAAGTVALLVAVVLLAAWLPARRAARIEPLLALRGN
jgi:predicted permease